MAISVKCSSCDKQMRVVETKRGKNVTCPACGEIVSIPDGDAESEFAADEMRARRQRSKKSRRKKSAPDAGLKTLIGFAIAVVAIIGIGLTIRRLSLNPGAPATLSAVQNANAANNSSSANASVTSPAVIVPANSTAPSSVQAPLLPQQAEVRDEDEAKVTPQTLSATDELFTQGLIPELRIELTEAEMERLKEGPRSFVIGAPRPYVQGTIHEKGKGSYQNVAIKLKGSAGSFRPVDDRPALSINVSKFEKDQTFHGLSKFHLNNSVQDDTYLHEWLCEELFRAAKLPATRVTHARVWLNERDLGLYVLKSGFDKAFLQRHFDDAKGNLYEGGFVQDIDVPLEKDSGKGPDDRSDLVELLEACREPNPETRWERIDELLNVDQFITFMAMELMTCHWDGYTNNHNNYRLYFDSTSNQAHFIPHGMDQVFGNTSGSIIDYPTSIVGSAVMLNGTWRARYRERVGELLALFSPVEDLMKRIDFARERLQPVLYQMNPQTARDHDDRVNKLKERLMARVASLIEQQSQSDPQPPLFDDDGRLRLAEWTPVSESPDAKLEIVQLPKGPRAYSILCGPKSPCNASWRCKMLLAKGTYILHANVETKTVVAKDEKNVAVGAGVRIYGMDRDNVRKGTANWTPLQFEFTVMEDIRRIEFVAELRARKGQVWFDADSLYLTRKSSE